MPTDVPENWTDGQTIHASDFNAQGHRINEEEDEIEALQTSGRVFVQQTDPATTNPEFTGPALWYVTDGSGKIIGKKVRASS